MADSTRRGLTQAAEAAAGLDAYLARNVRERPTQPTRDVAVDAAPKLAPGAMDVTRAKAGQGAPLLLASTDWLFHHLTVSGPAEALSAFQLAVAGSGTVPWVIDFDQAEEDWFHRLAAARQLSLSGARILSRQLREAAERRHTIAVARVGHSQACPLDLHAAVPVPENVLALGPDHPDSLAWLWQHWGTTETLRHVSLDGVAERRSSTADTSILRLCFWSANWSPWRALERLRDDWKRLCLDLEPQYAVDER